MEIQSRKVEGAEILSFKGELDFHSSGEVRDALTKLTDSQVSKVLLNFERVNYIDSSGLAVFVETFQKLKRSGGKLIFFNLAPAVRGVFEIARLDSIFKIASSEKEALTL